MHTEVAPHGVEVLWIPLGAGGWFVMFNGRVYEAVQALRQRRRAQALYHTALQVHLSEGRFVIENAWPIPAGDPAARGVVVQGPVGSRRWGRIRALRYEVRCWREGTIDDASYAIQGPQRVSDDEAAARRLLAVADQVPSMIWGRDELGVGDMWNSNSVVSWLLTRSGIDAGAIAAPSGGRAPGWRAGIAAARQDRSGP